MPQRLQGVGLHEGKRRRGWCSLSRADDTMAVEGVCDLLDDSTADDDVIMEDPQVLSVAIAEVDLTYDLSNEETTVIMDKEPQTPSTIAAEAE